MDRLEIGVAVGGEVKDERRGVVGRPSGDVEFRRSARVSGQHDHVDVIELFGGGGCVTGGDLEGRMERRVGIVGGCHESEIGPAAGERSELESPYRFAAAGGEMAEHGVSQPIAAEVGADELVGLVGEVGGGRNGPIEGPIEAIDERRISGSGGVSGGRGERGRGGGGGPGGRRGDRRGGGELAVGEPLAGEFRHGVIEQCAVKAEGLDPVEGGSQATCGNFEGEDSAIDVECLERAFEHELGRVPCDRGPDHRDQRFGVTIHWTNWQGDRAGIAPVASG